MYIPIKVDYGVRALVDLALYGAGGPVRASEIAKRTVIPEQYLAQVLAYAEQERLHGQPSEVPAAVTFLAMEPADIRLSNVMISLGGTETPVACLADNTICIHSPVCAQREVWRTVAEAVFNILDSTTIEDLVNSTPILPERDDSGVLPINLKTAV